MHLLWLIKNELIVLIVSIIPFIELRGAIPIGVGLGVSPFHALLIALFGNIMLVPILLLALPRLLRFIERLKFVQKILDRVKLRSTEKFERIKQKYGPLALFVFVAVPIPGTGAWSGALVATVLHMPFKSSLKSVVAGVFVAGLIVGLFSHILILF